jgi:hypothetical protein
VEPTAEFAQLQLGFVDQTQRRDEVIRPLVLLADRTAAQRARETQTHPDTVRKLQRRFQHQGMLGLLPSDAEVIIRERATRIPDAVRQEVDRLKALYDGFHYRELARILLVSEEALAAECRAPASPTRSVGVLHIPQNSTFHLCAAKMISNEAREVLRQFVIFPKSRIQPTLSRCSNRKNHIPPDLVVDRWAHMLRAAQPVISR